MEKVKFDFSVTQLAEYAFRSGHLDNFSVTGPTAQEGIQGHIHLQQKRAKENPCYQPEYALQYQYESKEYSVSLRGRVDGIIITDDSIWLEEIKTTYVEPDLLTEAVHSVQAGQLKIYAAMATMLFPNKLVTAQLTHLLLPKNTEFHQEYQWQQDELTKALHQAIELYCRWLYEVKKHRDVFQNQCRQLEFPYADFRPNQRSLSAEIYRHIRSSAKLVFEAPTGIGKTISTLFPGFKAIGEELVSQLVFLTAKKSGRRAACSAIECIEQSGCSSATICLSAKDSLCFCAQDDQESIVQVIDDDGKEFEICRYRRNFFDKLWLVTETCFKRAIKNGNLIDAKELLDIGRQFEICPFSLSLHLIPWFDVVICDFNYVFDPLVKLAHFEHYGQQIVLLVDEAHNLIDRSRQMYSAELHEGQLLQLIEKTEHRRFFNRQANRIATFMLKLDRQGSSKRGLGSEQRLSSRQSFLDYDETVWQQANLPEELITRFESDITYVMSEALRYAQDNNFSNDEWRWLKAIIRMNVILEMRNQHHVIFCRKNQQGLLDTIDIQILCMNAQHFLSQIYQQFKSIIFFSGTLRPTYYIENTLGLNDTRFLKVPSIFESKQLRVLVSNEVDTRFKYRERYYHLIAEYIHIVYQSKKGNYLVAFPSYQFLQAVLNIYQELYPDTPLLVQGREQSELERQNFIEKFFNHNDLLGFVILGGVYTEGVDFKGDALRGVIVVGVGFPAVSAQQQALMSDFENAGLNGFEFAYQAPGLQRVLQTAGRVIRQLSDKGVVVLLDKRFLRSQYRMHFPDFWLVHSFTKRESLKQHLHDFWHTE